MAAYSASTVWTFAYFEWVFAKLMRDPAPEGLPGLLPAAWIGIQRETVRRTSPP
jgi:hypothetical protein